MKAQITSFRRGRDVITGNHMILRVESITDKEKAESLLGKSVVWTSPGKNKKEIKGKIVRVHGNSGAVRAIFERGMPGQSIGEHIEIS